MKKFHIVLLSLTLAAVLCVTGLSLFGTDATFSASENRKLAQRPKFTLSSLLDGSFISAFEAYYSDTFPGREKMLELNRSLNKFYYYSGASEEDSVLVIGGSTGAENGGESLHDVQKEQEALSQTDAPDDTASADEQKPETPATEQSPDTPAVPDTPEAPAEEPPHIDTPDESEATYAGNVVVVGTRAMEIPTASDDLVVRYAGAVNNLAAALGSEVRTFSLVTPNGGEFYSPESMHEGLHSQKAMIDLCYKNLQSGVTPVDAYSALAQHVDEYLYFRTDHHWTQLGAYYAYTKFCEAAGFEAEPLDAFETGEYTNFVGSMYTFTSGYPQSQILKDNPDTLTYYLPIYETHAKYYADATLQNGVPISVVYTKLADETTNKYLCFIGGDTPVCVIESAAEGGVCMVLKESYGNAFVPFLTSHYSKIIVVDPREFNRDGKPSLDLASFAKEQGVNDLLVINYPYTVNSVSYINWLNRLVGKDPNWQ